MSDIQYHSEDSFFFFLFFLFEYLSDSSAFLDCNQLVLLIEFTDAIPYSSDLIVLDIMEYNVKDRATDSQIYQ